jgi:hypothetical protein
LDEISGRRRLVALLLAALARPVAFFATIATVLPVDFLAVRVRALVWFRRRRSLSGISLLPLSMAATA